MPLTIFPHRINFPCAENGQKISTYIKRLQLLFLFESLAGEKSQMPLTIFPHRINFPCAENGQKISAYIKRLQLLFLFESLARSEETNIRYFGSANNNRACRAGCHLPGSKGNRKTARATSAAQKTWHELDVDPRRENDASSTLS